MRTLDPARRTDEDTGRIDPEWCFFFYGRGHMKGKWAAVKGYVSHN